MKVHLTQAFVDKQRPGAPRRIRDDVEGGLLLEIGKTDVRWSVQFDRRRDAAGNALPRPETVKVKIGLRDEVDLKAAREKASEVKALIRRGMNPNRRAAAASEGPVTVRAAFEQKMVALRADGASDRTLELYEYALEALEEIADRPLSEIGADRRGLRKLRDRIAARATGRAGNAMKYLAAAYNHQMEVDDSLPDNPVERARLRPKNRRRLATLGVDDLPELRRLMRLVENPIRRALTQFIFLTGMRKTAATSIQLRDIHLGEAYIHVPAPKGGAEAAFDLPLSPLLVRFVRWRMRQNRKEFGPRCPWLFPSRNAEGEVVPCCDIRVKPVPARWVSSQMRKLYISRQGAAGVDRDTGSFLVNHKIGAARGHYASPQWDQMLACQTKMTRHLLGACRPKPDAASPRKPEQAQRPIAA
jgi:integrase